MERYQPYESLLQRAVRAAIAEARAERERVEHDREHRRERARASAQECDGHCTHALDEAATPTPSLR